MIAPPTPVSPAPSRSNCRKPLSPISRFTAHCRPPPQTKGAGEGGVGRGFVWGGDRGGPHSPPPIPSKETHDPPPPTPKVLPILPPTPPN